MTTIAYDGRLAAIDSLVTQGDTKFVEDKTFRFKTNAGKRLVVLGAGRLADIQAAVEELRHDAEVLPKGDYSLLVCGLKDDPVVFEGYDGQPVDTNGRPWVGGSGQHAALAVLYMGADAPKAVEIACKVDIHTGLPVRVYDTQTRRFRTIRGGKTTRKKTAPKGS